MKLDLTSIGGIAFGVGALVLGFILEGGRAAALLQPTSALIVLGGTIGATTVSFSMRELKLLPGLFRMAATRTEFDPVALIEQLGKYSDIVRKQQPLALEPEIERTNDPFLAKGLQLIVDNAEPELMRQMLETDLFARFNEQKTGASIFDSAGGYAPTMGIIGTVMGLVHVLGEISGNPNALAAAIGLAFIATLYGVSTANLLWLPLGNNLKVKAKQELLMRQIALEGLLAVLEGIPPMLLKERLMGFIRPSSPPTQGTNEKAAVAADRVEVATP